MSDKKEKQAINVHTSFTVTCDAHFQPGKRGRKKMENGEAAESENVEQGRIPRISRLMALAIHFDGLIKGGVVHDYADIARLGGITRARVTQIMNLLLLAPEIQERILFLPRIIAGKDKITEHEIREVLKTVVWEDQ
jgi:hypothetical protein